MVFTGAAYFRFEGDSVVEHWDNIQRRQGPNPSGHSMVDGPKQATDHALTETNRKLVRCFVDDVLVQRQFEKLESYIDETGFTQHDPRIGDGLSDYRRALEARSGEGFSINYDRNHRVLAEGSFVLAVSEGSLDGVPTSFYDLFRVKGGKLVERWNTIETIPPRSEWKNDNGKF